MIYALTGTGGMGKTDIAIEYAYRYQSTYTAVFWVFADSEDKIRTSFTKIMESIVRKQAEAVWPYRTTNYKIVCGKLGVPGLVDNKGIVKEGNEPKFFDNIRRALFDWLQREDNREWLLIIDGADDLQAFDKQKCLPNHGGGAILITSRRPEFARRGKQVNLDGLDCEDAIKLLLASAKSEDAREASKEEKEIGIAIVTELGFMPLAISQAGHYIQEANIPFDEYLLRYRKNFMEVQGGGLELGSDDQKRATTI